jgi:hypothetical protein
MARLQRAVRDTSNLGRKAGRAHMKKLLIIAALASTALIQSQPSQAYFRGTWCAKIDVGGGAFGERCDFPTFAACRNHIVGESRSFCVQNQWRGSNWGISDNATEYRFNRIYR